MHYKECSIHDFFSFLVLDQAVNLHVKFSFTLECVLDKFVK